MMIIRDVCPRCKSPKYKKNGHIHNGKQSHQCKDCGRQFVDCFEPYLVSDATPGLIERLLLERLALRRICRAVGVGLKWLLGFSVTCFEALPDHWNVQPISCDQGVIPTARHKAITKKARYKSVAENSCADLGPLGHT